MKHLAKLSIVLAAYVVAFLVAAEVDSLARASAAMASDGEASPGMAGFADFILFVEVFGIAAAAPTALAATSSPFPQNLHGGCHGMSGCGGHRAACRRGRGLDAQPARRNRLVAGLRAGRGNTNIPIAYAGPKLPGFCAACTNVALPLDIAGSNGNGRCGICLRACLAAVKSPKVGGERGWGEEWESGESGECGGAGDRGSALILHPSSFILHPSSFILHPSSFILHPSSFILHPSSFILHPSSFILHPSSFILHPSSIILHPFALTLTLSRR